MNIKNVSENKPSNLGSLIFNKVPEITFFFWVIKILCTTVGETAADFLNVNLNLGLTGTTLIMGALLMIVLIIQFKVHEYIPWIYWLAVVLISVVGTLITDNLTDNLGVSLQITTIVFAILLVLVFTIWYLSERTLSVHKINTIKREVFYWLAILFTFALGTAAGDLLAETMQVGYLISGLIFAGAIALVYLVHKIFKLNSVLSFWLAYILTRPMGASIGDYLSQPKTEGGIGMGTIITSAIFLTAILATVIYLTISKKDIIKLPS